jgi:hypothetical protein
VVPDGALLEAEAAGIAAGTDFLSKETDVSLQ